MKPVHSKQNHSIGHPECVLLVRPHIWLFACLFFSAPVQIADASETASAQPGKGDPSTPVVALDETIQKASGNFGDQLIRVLFLRDYNTRVVLLGTTLLGVVGGVVGTFMLLRKRALVGDVISHASLPGIAAAFIFIETAWPGHGKSLGGLLIGATISGFAGVGSVLLIRRLTSLKEDAALAIVLSVFFGAGIGLMTVLQDLPSGNMAGLQGFIYGKAAAMVSADIELISICAFIVLVLSTLLFKELAALCFDEGYTASQGLPVLGLDLVLMGMVAVVTVIGLQSVGLLLVVGMLIIPAAAARFWTDHLQAMTVIAAAIGGLAALLGVIASALFAKLAAGPIIILAGATLFVLSMLFSPKRGAFSRFIEHRRLQRRVDRQHLLRSCYEFVEPQLIAAPDPADASAVDSVPLEELQRQRTWSPRRLRRELSSAERDGLLWVTPQNSCRLTASGLERSRLIARNHRLWEMYLIEHADIAPSRVDRYADLGEHALEPEIVARIEVQLSERYPHLQVMPASPHTIPESATATEKSAID